MTPSLGGARVHQWLFFRSLANQGPKTLLFHSLAWAELYLTIATIFTRFDFELFETTIEDIELGSDILAPGTKSRNNVRVTVRKTKFET